MGYDLHISRRELWSDTGNDITAKEWLNYVLRDSALQLEPLNGPYFAAVSGSSGWLDWSDGEIYSKNPEPALIDKMVAISREFAATVQGDDGEIYDEQDATSPPQAFSLRERVRRWFQRSARRPIRTELIVGFGVGDRVRDVWGNEHTVISINPKANHGLGEIKTLRCSDGTVHNYALMGHPLEPLSGQ